MIEVDGCKITARKCDRSVHDRQCSVGPDDERVLVLNQASKVLPFGSPHVCYEFVINNANEGDEVCGCLSVHVPEKALDPKIALSEAVLRNEKKKAKTTMIKAFKLFDEVKKKGTGALVAYKTIIKDVFGDELLAEDLRSTLQAAHGWFLSCPAMRAVGKALFCMGFHDREAVVRVLATLSSEATAAEWFDSVGYGSESDRSENFRSLYASFRKMDINFINFVKEKAFEDSNAFFFSHTRPMALRSLGELNRHFFSQFCSSDVGGGAPGLPIHDATISLADGESNTDGTKVIQVAGEKVSVDTVALCRTLIALKSNGLLKNVSENELFKRSKPVFDCEGTLSGRGNEVIELHSICATKKICIGFDSINGGKTNIDDLKNRFMKAAAPTKGWNISVFVRDAQLLRCKQLAHLVWKAAARAVFKEFVLTTRFEYDPTYSGNATPFIAALFSSEEPAAGPDQQDALEGVKTIPDMKTEHMSVFSGVCVVPTARDAATDTVTSVAADGTHVFSITPPLFGRVVKHNSPKKVVLSLPMDSREIEVPLFHDRKKNVWDSRTTAARGVMVPASALIFQRKKIPMCNSKATVFVPLCFSTKQRKDMVDAAKAFFRTVTVIAVQNYKPPNFDNDAARRIIHNLKNAIAKV